MQWTESVGLTLVSRDLASVQLRTPGGQILTYCILQMFPFTSESKRMGVIVRVTHRSHSLGLARGSALTVCPTLAARDVSLCKQLMLLAYV